MSKVTGKIDKYLNEEGYDRGEEAKEFIIKTLEQLLQGFGGLNKILNSGDGRYKAVVNYIGLDIEELVDMFGDINEIQEDLRQLHDSIAYSADW